LPEGCDDLIFPAESNIAPIISPKKSLSSWIKKVASRAGIELWEKPFQNCRSSRDTELRKTTPEYLVNRWIGHTQQVAEAHYTQVLPGDFIDAYNAEKKGTKKGTKTVAEHAGIGCRRVDVDHVYPAATACVATTCNAMLRNVPFDKMPQKPSVGIEPTTSALRK